MTGQEPDVTICSSSLSYCSYIRRFHSPKLQLPSIIHTYSFTLFALWRHKHRDFPVNTKHLHNICTDRQTDILLTEKKSHYRLICHRNERDICTCIYKIVSLLKSYDNIHGMTYTAKIMLSGIAKIKTGYFDNINDYY